MGRIAIGVNTKRHLEGRNHLSLFLAVDEVIMVLHRYEGREFVYDSIVCLIRMRTRASTTARERDLLCEAWTVVKRGFR